MDKSVPFLLRRTGKSVLPFGNVSKTAGLYTVVPIQWGQMKVPIYSNRPVPRRSVTALKRIAYGVALLLGAVSVSTELHFGSPTQDLAPAVAQFDWIVFPVIVPIIALALWLSVFRQGPVSAAAAERFVGVVYLAFFLVKFSFALMVHPGAPPLAFVESWYWMLIGVWLFTFIAFDYNRALLISLGTYSAVLAVHASSVLQAPLSVSLAQYGPDLLASHLRMLTTLPLVVLLGRIKHQWVVAEEEAEALRDIAHLDPLTKLPNRRFLNETLAKLAAGGEPFTVILFDLDGFKKVNDRFGHGAGDEILEQVGDLARAHARDGDTVGRWGGEEFLLLCPDTDLEQGTVVAERMRRTLEVLRTKPGREVTASFGVAEHRPGETPERLVSRADEALYEAKARGKNTVVPPPPPDIPVPPSTEPGTADARAR